MTRPRLLGIAASLRNARWGLGNRDLTESIIALETEEALKEFLTSESELHLENFVQAGREAGLPFDQTYANLKKNSGRRGLSNSEVALASALWSASRFGVEIDHVSLAEHFPATGTPLGLEDLEAKLETADGILLSGPVYFGDRGSLAQSLLEHIRSSPRLRDRLRGKIYGGIAVGAKRNGGQETCLIYQMLDFARLGLVAVGNDSDTTSQYGGTGLAGDVGTMARDDYGLWTSMGTGRRMGRLLQKSKATHPVRPPARVLFLVLQDRAGEARSHVRRLVERAGDRLEATVVDLTQENVMRCIACDICPTHIDVDKAYRCIITSGKDGMEALHPILLDHDAIVPVTLSVEDPTGLASSYQTFIERTRYLRRGDYVFSNQLVMPLAFEEVGHGENYAIRMMTSMIRHNTMMFQPLTAHLYDGKWVDVAGVERAFERFLDRTLAVASIRLGDIHSADVNTKYNPVGYILSADKDAEDEKLGKRRQLMEQRFLRLAREAEERFQPEKTAGG